MFGVNYNAVQVVPPAGFAEICPHVVNEFSYPLCLGLKLIVSRK